MATARGVLTLLLGRCGALARVCFPTMVWRDCALGFMSLSELHLLRTGPVLTHTDRSNAASSSGYSMTLAGENLGGVDATPAASLAHLLCATTQWRTASGLLCTSPQGLGTGLVGVSGSSVSGTGTAVFSFDGAVLVFFP